MSIATLSILASVPGAMAARGAQSAAGGSGTVQRGGNTRARTAPHRQHAAPPAPAKPQPKPQVKPQVKTNAKQSPLAPDILPQAPISDAQIKSANELFQLIGGTVAKDNNGKISLTKGSKTMDITQGITKSMLPKLKDAGIEISDNLFAAIAKGSKLESEMTTDQSAASKPEEISLDELNIFLEENLKEFAKMQGDTNLQRIFGLYNKAGSFKRATEEDKKAIESNSSKINTELQKQENSQQVSAQTAPPSNTIKWEVVHANAAKYLGGNQAKNADSTKSHELICYAANRLEIKLDKDISAEDLGRISKFISFIPWLLKNMPETAIKEYGLPEWLKDQKGPASLKDEDVKEWYKKILAKKTEQTSANKTDEEKSHEAKFDDAVTEGLTSDKKASKEQSKGQA